MAKDQDPQTDTAVVPVAQDVAVATDQPEYDWVTVDTGLGKEWDFERNPTMVGVYTGAREQQTKDPQNPGTKRKSTAHLFTTAEGEDVFLWESAALSQAFAPDSEAPVMIGDLVRITFTGRENFTGEKGPQQIKRYRVQRAVKRSMATAD